MVPSVGWGHVSPFLDVVAIPSLNRSGFLFVLSGGIGTWGLSILGLFVPLSGSGIRDIDLFGCRMKGVDWR